MSNKLVYGQLSYKLTGVLFYIHNQLGRYCNHQQYCDSIENELKKINLSYKREEYINLSFEGEKSFRNKFDFLIENKIILEIKAKRIISKEDYYQTKRYLKALNKELGIIVNFRDKFLKPKRILNSLS